MRELITSREIKNPAFWRARFTGLFTLSSEAAALFRDYRYALTLSAMQRRVRDERVLPLPLFRSSGLSQSFWIPFLLATPTLKEVAHVCSYSFYFLEAEYPQRFHPDTR